MGGSLVSAEQEGRNIMIDVNKMEYMSARQFLNRLQKAGPEVMDAVVEYVFGEHEDGGRKASMSGPKTIRIRETFWVAYVNGSGYTAHSHEVPVSKLADAYYWRVIATLAALDKLRAKLVRA